MHLTLYHYLDIAEPLTPVLITGEVNVLFVNACEPANVATVASILTVRVLALPTVVIPVPPPIPNVFAI